MNETTSDSENSVGRSLIHVLVSDVQAALSNLETDSNQSNKRTVIRAVFAAIEGGISIARQTVLQSGPRFIALSCHEIASLREETYNVGNDGTVKAQPKYITVTASIRQLSKLITRINPDYKLDLNHPAWGYLASSLTVRNRLTHPKKLKDLEVSDAELSKAVMSFYWVLAFVIEVLSNIVESLEEKVEFAMSSKIGQKNQTTTAV